MSSPSSSEGPRHDGLDNRDEGASTTANRHVRSAGDAPVKVVRLEDMDRGSLQEYLEVDADVADELLRRASDNEILAYALARVQGLRRGLRERVLRNLIPPTDQRLAILEIVPVGGRIMSDQSFVLQIHFSAAALSPPRLVSVRVEWAGDSFINEVLLNAEDVARGYVEVAFTEAQTLPVGSASFVVLLYSAVGTRARFRRTFAVLPSNPFSLTVGPDVAYVTGTWSARALRHGDAYDTGVAVTLMNGDDHPVQVRPGFHWRFWDGGVGGSLVEEADGSFPGGSITVPAYGTWGGWISFHSPSGSGIYNRCNSREDMTIELSMTRADGGTVSGRITARTMFRYGVNITRVAGEDFVDQEWTDLFVAADRSKTIYERRDMTFDIDDRFIPRNRVGGYEIIDSYDEFHALLSDWSGPDTNANIDAFIVQAISVGGGVDGIDGSIPGPTSHGGPDSGLIASKTGYVDTNGVWRLHADYLGMLIGHELGHYLGLEHAPDAGNLMLWNSGTDDINLTYGQYRTMIHHGWVRID